MGLLRKEIIAECMTKANIGRRDLRIRTNVYEWNDSYSLAKILAYSNYKLDVLICNWQKPSCAILGHKRKTNTSTTYCYPQAMHLEGWETMTSLTFDNLHIKSQSIIGCDMSAPRVSRVGEWVMWWLPKLGQIRGAGLSNGYVNNSYLFSPLSGPLSVSIPSSKRGTRIE